MSVINVNDVSVAYQDQVILQNVSMQIPAGQVTSIIGANGSGKSTLLKTVAGLLQPKSGEVLLDGKNLSTYKKKVLAQKVGLLPQALHVPSQIRVSELVARGRYPYQKMFADYTAEDYEKIQWAMDMTRISELADHFVSELSGGQQQRVWIALVLAQDTDILLLDEPTTYLDLSYQIELLDLLIDLNRDFQKTIVMVLHDINLAARYSHYLYVLKNGRPIADGSPNEILSQKLMSDAFALNTVMYQDSVSGQPYMVPVSRHDQGENRAFSE